jgi:hypothetical protein
MQAPNSVTRSLTMSGHGCNDEHDSHGHGEHSHSHDTPVEDIPRETLYSIIDHQNVMALNVVQQNNILKPWEDRNDETVVSFTYWILYRLGTTLTISDCGYNECP